MLSYKRKFEPTCQWPYKSEKVIVPFWAVIYPTVSWAFSPGGFTSCPKLTGGGLSSCFFLLSTSLSPHRHTLSLRQLLAISLSSANCLNLVASCFLPQPSSCLLILIGLSQNFIFNPATRVQIQQTDSSHSDEDSGSSAVSSGLNLLRKQPPLSRLHAKITTIPFQSLHSSSWMSFISV